MANAARSCSRTPEERHSRRFRLALLIFACWLIAASVAFYSFEFQPLRPFYQASETELSAYPPILDSLLPAQSTGRATVIHLLDPDCECLRYTRPHIASLQKKPAYIDADHILVSSSVSGLASSLALDQLRPALKFEEAALDAAVRSPAVAIFDRNQKLAYFGPYSLGPACGSAGDVVMPVLESIQLSTPVPEYDLTARTCFCDPPSQLLSASLGAGGAPAK